MPTVSVVVTAHDEEAFLAAALDSVLAQDPPADEIVVVDDASADRTPEVIAAYSAAHPDRIRAVALQPNRGAPAARNAGAAAARGELLAFLDGDDLWLSHKLDVQLGLLAEHPEVAYTYASAIELRDGRPNDTVERLGSPTGVYRPPDLCLGYLRDAYWNFWPSGLLIRRAAFAASGGFVEPLGAWQHWEDYFYACKLSLYESAFVLDEPLTWYRVHPRSCSRLATESRKTIVDERVGIEWFAPHLAATAFPQCAPMRQALRARLARNADQFASAVVDHPALATFAPLYTAAAIERVTALIGR